MGYFIPQSNLQCKVKTCRLKNGFGSGNGYGLATVFSLFVCIGFILLLQTPRDTTRVIPRTGQNVPLNDTAGSALLDPSFPILIPDISLSRPRIHAEVGRYRVRLSESGEDREAACRLRFKVFNIELGEGLETSYETGLDTDQFDAFCEHLLVEDRHQENPSRRIVGTYRMQSGATAARNLGYYSEQEFNFAPYEPLRPGILELGRASIDREHRTPEVLTLLWRGIAQYAHDMGLRYLVGCSSLNSNNPAEGWQLYRQLEHYRVCPEFETVPTTAFACPNGPGRELERSGAQPSASESKDVASDGVKVPKLLKTYLAIGARIAAPPAWDRAFGTIDFLTVLDLKLLSSAARHRFLAPLTQ
jgi:putative hemolysin